MGERKVPAWKVARRMFLTMAGVILAGTLFAAVVWFGLRGLWWLWCLPFASPGDAETGLAVAVIVLVLCAVAFCFVMGLRQSWQEARRDLEDEADAD